MIKALPVFFVSLITFAFGFAAFRFFEEQSFQDALWGLIALCFCWIVGAVTSRLVAGRWPLLVRWLIVFFMSYVVLAWTLWGLTLPALIGLAFTMVLVGAYVPSHIHPGNNTEEFRKSYSIFLAGACCGLLSAVLFRWLGGPGGILFFIPIVLAIHIALGSDFLFLGALEKLKRFRVIIALAILAVLIGTKFATSPVDTPAKGVHQEDLNSAESSASYGNEIALNLSFGPTQKLDVLIAGNAISSHVQLLVAGELKDRIRSLTLVEQEPGQLEALRELKIPTEVFLRTTAEGVERFLRKDDRRYDVIQIITPEVFSGAEAARSSLSGEPHVTIESVRFLIDHLKQDGVLHFPRSLRGDWGRSVMATVAEAWKKLAKANPNLHILGVAAGDPLSRDGFTLRSVIVRLKPYLKEERDTIERSLDIHQAGSVPTAEERVPPNGEKNYWYLATDSNGVVLTNDRPVIGRSITSSGDLSFLPPALVVTFLGLILWVVLNERRKEVVSRWQTLSVASYFGGLGVSLALFEVFFSIHAMRMWGVQAVGIGLAMSVLLGSLALGAMYFAGHPKRRYGVRIQTLTNFVLAVLFTYLAMALFEPLIKSISIWMAVVIGMSLLIPFGVFGGAFFPNALEEASDKLPPRSLPLLWAIFASGTSIGCFVGVWIVLNFGLDLTYLAGLFCFAWVAIVSGIIRPWGVRSPVQAET